MGQDGHRESAGLQFPIPPSLPKTASAARSARGASFEPGRIAGPRLRAPLSACVATSRAHTAINGTTARDHSRTVVVGEGICGAGARCEEWVCGPTGVTPSGVGVYAWVSGPPRAGGVLADAVYQIGAGSAGAEEIFPAAGGGGGAVVCCGADNGQGIAEDVADVEKAAWVRFEDCAVGVGVAVGA